MTPLDALTRGRIEFDLGARVLSLPGWRGRLFGIVQHRGGWQLASLGQPFDQIHPVWFASVDDAARAITALDEADVGISNEELYRCLTRHNAKIGAAARR